jgi:hypothetical protein
MLPTWLVKISTYLHSEQFLSVIFIIVYLNLLIIFVQNLNVLCYVVLRYHVLIYFSSTLFFFFLFLCYSVFFLTSVICSCLYIVFILNVITSIYTVRVCSWTCNCWLDT